MSVAQIKGCIERLNLTFQSRIPIELRYAHIHNTKEANEFLKPYLKKSNDLFALYLNTTKSAFETQPLIEKKTTLAVLSTKKIDSDHCIKYHNKYYLPVRDKGVICYLKKKTNCIAIKSFDNKSIEKKTKKYIPIGSSMENR